MTLRFILETLIWKETQHFSLLTSLPIPHLEPYLKDLKTLQKGVASVEQVIAIDAGKSVLTLYGYHLLASYVALRNIIKSLGTENTYSSPSPLDASPEHTNQVFDGSSGSQFYLYLQVQTWNIDLAEEAAKKIVADEEVRAKEAANALAMDEVREGDIDNAEEVINNEVINAEDTINAPAQGNLIMIGPVTTSLTFPPNQRRRC